MLRHLRSRPSFRRLLPAGIFFQLPTPAMASPVVSTAAAFAAGFVRMRVDDGRIRSTRFDADDREAGIEPAPKIVTLELPAELSQGK